MQDYIYLALEVIGTLSLIAAATPTPKDDGILYALRQLLSFAAGHVGHAQPASHRDVEESVRKAQGDAAKAGVKKIAEKLRRRK